MKFDWYQHQNSVCIVFYVKNAQPQDYDIKINPSSVDVYSTSENTSLVKSFQLLHEIDPSTSTTSFTPFKFIITLPKRNTSIEWDQLEVSLPKPSTSSPTCPNKDWSKIDEESEESSNIDDFFKSLYGNADEDTKRAMMKSFYESKGTCLSTNWQDVGSRFVTPKPPNSSST